ncbi:MAG: DNA mismatch repair endonuclease MutL [Anaerolineae bacterium]|nr:DNA mismatch repair endonuclease MutL [Anaerolineae bacterium]
MPISVLPPEVVEKIAAGEVIERPASVVKELVENSLDSGASRIEVHVADAGLTEITVQDDGCGIPAAEVEVAFRRHATSKLLSLDDLDRLRTLGFRGEALASIAAVSDVTLSTRHRGEPVGSRVRVRFGQKPESQPEAHGRGTMVTVRDLFANVPARRRFLRRPSTETQQVVSLVSRYAVAHPEVSFALTVDGRPVLRTVGGGLLDAIRRVHGPEVGDALIPFDRREEGLRAYGYAGPPHLHRSSSRHMDTFVNGRLVQDRLLTRATMEAYRELLPTRRYPLVILLLECDPAEVDVNVHPAKAEVRFADPDRVFQASYRALREAVADPAIVPSFGFPARDDPDPDSRQALLRLVPAGGRGDEDGWDRQEPGQMPPASLSSLPPLRPVGQVQLTYIVAEGPDGLYLVDQHAAHERVLYEKFMSQRSAGRPESQALISPTTVDLGAERASRLDSVLPRLREMGFDAEAFGPGTVILRSVPAMLAQRGTSVEDALTDVVDSLALGEEERWLEHSLVRLVCHSALRAGEALDYAEMRQLLRDLEATSTPRTCPHGRPTMLYLSAAQVEREFRRH